MSINPNIYRIESQARKRPFSGARKAKHETNYPQAPVESFEDKIIRQYAESQGMTVAELTEKFGKK